MLNAFWWILTVEAIGLAAFPIAYLLLPGLRDRGYSISKPLGIVLLGYASWILSVLHIVPSVRASIAILLVAIGAASALYAWRRRGEMLDLVLREWKMIAAIEAVFLVFFIGWAVFRAYDPAINHTEQPMDFAFLNASIESRVGSPSDPWMSGESVSYYYFGYWMMGSLSQLTGAASSVSYNLAMALFPALGAAAMFGLVANLVRYERTGLRHAVVAGFAATLLMGIVGNLEGVLELMRVKGVGSQGFWDWIRIDGLDGVPAASAAWAPQEAWWWFHATRVINSFEGDLGLDYTIQEFPFFSHILGDLHPHVMSVPFVVMFAAFCWSFLQRPRRAPGGAFLLLAMGLILGGLAFTNMWDLPVFAGLFLGAACLRAYRLAGPSLWIAAKTAAPAAAAVVGLAFVFYLPYYLSFGSSIGGIAPVVEVTTRPIHLLIVWALFLVAVIPFTVGAFLQTTVTEDWRRLAIIALIVAFLPYAAWALFHLLTGGTLDTVRGRFFHQLPLALPIGAAVYAVFWLVGREGISGRVFALMLAALGLLLVLGPELFFVRDFFNSRMNTVFKLYYQAWVLLAAASGFSIYYWCGLRAPLSGWKRPLTTLWATVFAVLLIASLYYPFAAAPSKAREASGEATLDGMAFVAQSYPEEYEAIGFLQANADRGSTMVEAVGEWGDAGMISRSTGVPTILNWPGHERQWRGALDELRRREADVARIYQTEDAEEAKTLLDRYNVDYVYVGPREIRRYGSHGMAKFSDFAETVFSRETVSIYRIVRQ